MYYKIDYDIAQQIATSLKIIGRQKEEQLETLYTLLIKYCNNI